MCSGLAFFAFYYFGSLFGVEYHAERLVVIKIIPYPIEQYHHLIAHAQDRAQVNNEPHQPRPKALHFDAGKLGYGFIATYGSHCTEVFVAKRLELFAFEHAAEVVGEIATLLNGGLCQLRMPVGIFGVALNKALIANAEYIVEPDNTVKGVDADASPTTKMFRIEVTHRLSGHATDPDKGAGRYGRTVCQHHFVVLIVGYHLVEQNVDTHLTQIFFDGSRRFGRHGR